MGQVTLNYQDCKRILDNPDADPDARVIAACFIAFHETNNHVEGLDPASRSIVLKLSHMTAAVIYGTPTSDDNEVA